MQISVDPTICVGAGQCVLTAPELFDQGDDGLVLVLHSHIDTADGRAAAVQAGELCPSGAITIKEDDG